MPSGKPVSVTSSESSLSTESEPENDTETAKLDSKIGVKKFRELMEKDETDQVEKPVLQEDKDEIFLNTVKQLKQKRENKKKLK